MPQGLEVLDSSSNVIFSVTSSLSRVLGTQTLTSNVPGSLSDSRLSTGNVFWSAMPAQNGQTYSPQITYNPSTNTISWTWPLGGATHFMIYGVY